MRKMSVKQLQINKANTTIVVVTAAAAFLTTMSLVASRALLQKRAYQAHLISSKTLAKKQLDDNVKAADSLVASYKQFVGQDTNVLGGSSTGQGDHDGDNARIVLDALPSKYDFPAVATSLEKILTSKNFQIKTITGVDDELGQAAVATSDAPQPVPIPFQLDIGGNYKSSQDLLEILDRSIRPIRISKLTISGTVDALSLNISGETYYQPEKTMSIKMKVVK